jgi:hypothetical protein
MLQSTNEACHLNLSQLPIQAREAHIIPGLSHSSLISIGKLCDEGCTATFTVNKVVITHDHQEVLVGTRDNTTGLWRIPLNNTNTSEFPIQPTSSHECHNAYQKHRLPELLQYLHAALFSPIPSTWIAAINRGFFLSWPRVTAAAVRKH